MSKTAIAASRGTIFKVDPKKLVIVGIDTAHKSKREHPLWQPRINLPINHDMVESMVAFGPIEPVECRKNGTNKDGSDVLEVIFGVQRTRSLRIANDIRVKKGLEPWPMKVLVTSRDDNEAGEVIQVENHQRQNDDKITTALAMREQLDLGKDEEYVARVLFRCDVQTMQRTLALLDLDDEVKRHVQTGALSAHAAYELRGEPRERQREIVRELLGTPRAGVSMPAGDHGDDEEASPAAAKAPRKAPTAKDIKKKVAEAAGKDAYEKPSKVLLNRIIAEWEIKGSKNQIKNTIDQHTINVLRWVAGKGDKNRVSGLTEVVGYIEEKYSKKK